ncbi:hypothetical protein [Ralstonia sp.]|uniref:hypothetical protein n=1 Tax=Ralstonia sp. TaxID=54061 RepID=UPI0031D6ACA0
MAPSCGRDLNALRTATDVPAMHLYAAPPTRPAPTLHNGAMKTLQRTDVFSCVVA